MARKSIIPSTGSAAGSSIRPATMFRSTSAAVTRSGASSIFTAPIFVTKPTARRICGASSRRSFSSTGILPVGRIGILPVLSAEKINGQDARWPHRQDARATSLFDAPEQKYRANKRDHDACKQHDQIGRVEFEAGAIKIHQPKRAAKMGQRK